jgi:branched-chain amino acid transport system substrate-binding protein
MGQPLYNRGVVNAMFMVEAIRTAMGKDKKVPTGEQMRVGFETLSLSEARLAQLGMKGFTHPIKVTCDDHEGNGPVMIEQWDGKDWKVVSGWIEPMKDVVRPKIEAAAVEEGTKLSYTKRECK